MLEYAKTPIGVFELPCGYIDPEGRLHTSVEVREISGDEEDLLAADKMPQTKKISELLARCTSRVGVYSGATARHVMPGLTMGDRTFLMFAIRRVSLGDEYPFVDKCPNCEQSQLFMLDLSELEITAMPNPMKRNYELTLPKSKKVVGWHVMVGKDEEVLGRFSKAGFDNVSLGILVRLDTFDGKPVDLSPKAGKPASLQVVKSLGMQDRNALRDAFEEFEGGIETTMDMVCPSCGFEFSRELDVGQTGFFFPSRALRDWKKKSRS
jgi:hypothetical protein